MKKLLFSVMLVCLFGSTSFLSANYSAKVNYSVQDDQNKTKITFDQLPQAVKDKLASADYKDWLVGDIYLVSGEDKEYYKIELTKGDEKKTVKLDKDGMEKKDKI